MPINISFGGATISRTGAFSTVDTANMAIVTLGASKVLAMVGQAGVGHTLSTTSVSYFNDPQAATLAVKECELLDMMRIAWQHGADIIGVVPVVAAAANPTDSEWQTAIDLMNNEYVDGIVPVTTAPAIHIKIDTHVTAMSTVTNRKRRRAFYGHATGMDTTSIVALQTALPTERGIMASPAVYVFDSTGEKVLKGSHYLAAAYAGLWASQEPQEPITYKYVKFAGLGKVYDSVAIKALLDGHIAPVEYVRNKGYRIVQGQTLATSTDLTKNELSVSTLKDVISDNLESFFEEKYVGKAGVKGIEVTMYNDLITLIESFEKAGWIAGYVPESVRVIKNGTIFTLEWEGQPTLPINNFLITSHFTL
jgi:hypothetical protein